MADALPLQPQQLLGQGPAQAVDIINACALLESRLTTTLKSPDPKDFSPRLEAERKLLKTLVERESERVLVYLIYKAQRELHNYSVQHAILVATICLLVTRELNTWPEDDIDTLMLAALSMNLSITRLQDELAMQPTPLTPEQDAQLANHGQRSAALLSELGVVSSAVLNTVELHHDTIQGSMDAMTVPQRMARLLQRIDTFCAQLSPRESREAQCSTTAVMITTMGESGRLDEVGTALLNTLGLYPPGGLVRLDNQEVALVLRCRARLNEPVVAALISGEGKPLERPLLRDTHSPSFRVQASVAPSEVRFEPDLLEIISMI